MPQIFFPERLLACSELSVFLTALLSAQQTSDGAVCAAAVLCQVPHRLQNCGMKNIFINLAPSSTGALVPGSEMSQSFAGRWVVSIAWKISCLLNVALMSVPFCMVWGRGSFHQWICFFPHKL